MNKRENDPNEIEIETEGAEIEIEAKKEMEQKDARGGNHNPEGANQYTTGRNDDRGRKANQEAKENKGRE